MGGGRTRDQSSVESLAGHREELASSPIVDEVEEPLCVPEVPVADMEVQAAAQEDSTVARAGGNADHVIPGA